MKFSQLHFPEVFGKSDTRGGAVWKALPEIPTLVVDVRRVKLAWFLVWALVEIGK